MVLQDSRVANRLLAKVAMIMLAAAMAAAYGVAGTSAAPTASAVSRSKRPARSRRAIQRS